MASVLYRLVCLLYFLFLPAANCKFQYISVTKPGGEKLSIGCLPAQFSGDIDKNQSAFKAVLADPIISCFPSTTALDNVLHNVDSIKGNVAIIKRSKDVECEEMGCCTFQMKATVCDNSGAKGVVVINDNEDAVLPITMASVAQKFSSGSPICMITFKDGEELISAVKEGGDVMVDFKNIQIHQQYSDDPPITDHGTLLWTYISVVSPFSIKLRHYAANVLWNPEIVTDKPVTAPIVKANVEMTCPWEPEVGTEFQYHACSIKGCYVARVTNPEEVAGKIAYIDTRDMGAGDFVYCAHEDELAAAAQDAGAVGVLSTYTYLTDYHIPFYVSPRYRPYNFTIPMYIIRGYNGLQFNDLLGRGEEIVVRFPPVDKNHEQLPGRAWPETYYPDVETYGALSLAKICTREFSSEERVCYEAGQAKFNPTTSGAVEAEIVMGMIDPSCHGNDLEGDGQHDYGTDCDRCHQLLDDDQALLNPDDVNGNIVMILANDTFCIDEWEQLVDNVALHDAAGIIIGNTGEFTLTLVDTMQDIVEIPVFNIAKSRAHEMRMDLMTTNLTGYLPRIEGGVVMPSNATSHPIDTSGIYGLTQIKMEYPHDLEGIIDAGQSDFNPTFTGGQFDMVKAIWIDICNSEWSCHTCEMWDNPAADLYNNYYKGKVAVVDVKEVMCFLPFTNTVRFLQEKGAAAVIFVNEDDEQLTLSNGGFKDEEMKIPSFNIGVHEGTEILTWIEKQMADNWSYGSGFSQPQNPATAVLPDVKTVTVVINEEGEGNGGEEGEDGDHGEDDEGESEDHDDEDHEGGDGDENVHPLETYTIKGVVHIDEFYGNDDSDVLRQSLIHAISETLDVKEEDVTEITITGKKKSPGRKPFLNVEFKVNIEGYEPDATVETVIEKLQTASSNGEFIEEAKEKSEKLDGDQEIWDSVNLDAATIKATRIKKGHREEIVNIADETVEIDGDEEVEQVDKIEEDFEPTRKKREGIITNVVQEYAGIIGSAVVLGTIALVAGVHQFRKTRRRNRMLAAYNAVNSGTQADSDGFTGVVNEIHNLPASGFARAPDGGPVVITARPWKSELLVAEVEPVSTVLGGGWGRGEGRGGNGDQKEGTVASLGAWEVEMEEMGAAAATAAPSLPRPSLGGQKEGVGGFGGFGQAAAASNLPRPSLTSREGVGGFRQHVWGGDDEDSKPRARTTERKSGE